VERCREIMAAGEDWRGRTGDVARAEVVIATARGDFNLAYREFESALAIYRKFHLAAEEADTFRFWGRAFAAAGNRERAGEKFDACLELNRARGVGPRFMEYVQADRERALGSTATQIDLVASVHTASATSTSTGEFRKEGDFWTIAYAGTTFRLKDAKGLRYIAYLLAHPGQRFHVHDLIEAVEGSATDGRISSRAESEGLSVVRDIGGSGPSIDARARSEYGTRLRDLQAELDEAERMNDLGRTELLRTEIEIVGQELTGSSGLGGRRRAQPSSAERARGVVRKNIRATLDKIRHEHPALGRDLAAAISMGYFCAYQPEHPVFWQL
jgi:tetratricopeptide (TPR) repeat protein